MVTLLQDIRFAFRQLRSHAGFTFTAILSLALGIGATVSVFSIAYAVLLNPWPYAGADRIGLISLLDKAGEETNWSGLTGPQIRQLRRAQSLEDVMGINDWNLTVTGSDVPEDVVGVYLTPTAFGFLGVPAMIGRAFLPSDAPDGKEPQPVVVLGYKFWQRHFNGDPAVAGKPIRLAQKTYTILGIMPPRFAWMGGDVYLPLNLSTSATITYGLDVKLKPGVTRAAAAAELEPLFQQFAKETPNHFPKQYRLVVRDLNFYFSTLGKTINLLFGAVGLLLLIGCANVSILLMARGTARQHEFGVRAAVGASGFRIIRQLLTESLLLAVSGATIGVLLAYASLHAIVSRLPEGSFPGEADFHVNFPVLVFSVGLALLTAVLFGLFPALQLSRPQISRTLQANTRKVAGTVRGKHFHDTLIAGQIALTLLLMTSAGAAIQGFLRLMRVPLGYDPHFVMAVGIPIHHDNTYKTVAERIHFYDQMRARISELPDVLSTGISTNATPPANGWDQPFEISGKGEAQEQKARLNFVDPGYFKTLAIPLRRGRIWDETEIAHSAPLVLVNESFQKRFLPDGETLGGSIKISSLKNEPPYTIASPGSDGWLQVVGVVSDALDDGLGKPVKPAIFLPYSMYLWMHTQILIRSRVEPQTILHSVRRQIAAVDKDQQAMGRVDDLEEWIRREPEWSRGRLISLLFGSFAALALVLSAVGLYSVVSYSVAQRTNEFGIRMALGAQKGDVLRNVLSSAGVSIGLGFLAGITLSVALSRLISSWVENSAHSPLLFIGTCLVLLSASGLACLIPSWRASSVDPMTALRCE